MSFLPCEYGRYRHAPSIFDWCALDIDQVETARIPNYGEYRFLGLDSMPLSFRNLCIRLRPNELMVCVQVKLYLVEHHNIVPRSLFLPFQH
jgi:hypothetical protein